MKLSRIAFAGAALCALAACSTTSGATVDSALTSATTALQAAEQVVSSDASAGIITSAQSSQIEGYITAGEQALAAAQSAYAAGDATTEQQQIADVTAAVVQINSAVLVAVEAHDAAAVAK